MILALLANMIVIGLTGGICSGKSSIATILKDKCNAEVIDADKLGHQAYEPGTSCFDSLIQHFGETIKSEEGTINRKALGAIVFSDKEKMKELESIVWPEIKNKIIDEINHLKNNDNVKCIVLEAAIMIEAGWLDLVNSLWIVTVDPSLAKQRLMKRNNLSEEEALKRINAQMSNTERTTYGHHVIDNSGISEAELQNKVFDLYSNLNKE